MVNATASFSQDRTEVQSILLNAVYGSVNDDDWRSIENKDDNNIGDEPGGSGYSSNGSGGSTNGDVSTGDETPIPSKCSSACGIRGCDPWTGSHLKEKETQKIKNRAVFSTLL